MYQLIPCLSKNVREKVTFSSVCFDLHRTHVSSFMKLLIIRSEQKHALCYAKDSIGKTVKVSGMRLRPALSNQLWYSDSHRLIE